MRRLIDLASGKKQAKPAAVSPRKKKKENKQDRTSDGPGPVACAVDSEEDKLSALFCVRLPAEATPRPSPVPSVDAAEVARTWAAVRDSRGELTWLGTLWKAMLAGPDHEMSDLAAFYVEARYHDAGEIKVQEHFPAVLAVDQDTWEILTGLWVGPVHIKQFLDVWGGGEGGDEQVGNDGVLAFTTAKAAFLSINSPASGEAHQLTPAGGNKWAEAIKSFLVRDVPARRRRQGWAVAHRFCDIGAFDADKWRCPPLKHAFSCQPVAPPEAGYWLALADGPADAALAGRVRSATYVGDNDGGVGTLCPYLLVDYLAGTDAKPSTSRLLYCAAFVLYNRYRLRERALGGGAAARAEDLGDVRHYALAFSRRRFQMWCLRPKTPTEAGSVSYPSKSGYTADADADADADAGPVEGSSRAGGDGPATGGGSGNAFPAADGNDNGIMGGIQAVPQHWCGCNASLLLDGACASEEDLGELARWLNGIHRWGLTRHAAAVEADCVKLT